MIIVGKDPCVWCDRAKEALADFNIPFETWYPEMPVLKQVLKLHGVNTVPQIFHNGERIGGYDDLMYWLSDYPLANK